MLALELVDSWCHIAAAADFYLGLHFVAIVLAHISVFE